MFIKFFHRRLALLLIPMWCLGSANMATSANAVLLDTPPKVNASDFQAKVRSHFAANGQRSRQDQARDSNVTRQFVDLQWEMQELLNAGHPIKGLEDLGITPRAGGAVALDAKRFPQWIPFSDQLLMLEDATAFTTYSGLLIERGFREKDLVTLKSYLTANPSARLTYQATKPQVASYSAQLRKSGQLTTLAQAKAYHYQVRRIYAEVLQKWSQGALDSLEPQQQRVLISTLQELSPLRVVYPDKNVEAVLQAEMVEMRSAGFAERMNNLEKEYQQ